MRRIQLKCHIHVLQKVACASDLLSAILNINFYLPIAQFYSLVFIKKCLKYSLYLNTYDNVLNILLHSLLYIIFLLFVEHLFIVEYSLFIATIAYYFVGFVAIL